MRLLESRKSARLINSDTDFSKLADLNISQSACSSSLGSSTENIRSKTKAIEVPQRSSDYVQIPGSRKRRTSETLYTDDEETMTECSAAMLLMKLSCSPHNNPFHASSLPSYPSLPSPVDSSGASSFRSGTPSPPLSSSTGTSTADEGIVKDLYEQRRRRNVSSQQKPVFFSQNSLSLRKRN